MAAFSTLTSCTESAPNSKTFDRAAAPTRDSVDKYGLLSEEIEQIADRGPGNVPCRDGLQVWRGEAGEAVREAVSVQPVAGRISNTCLHFRACRPSKQGCIPQSRLSSYTFRDSCGARLEMTLCMCNLASLNHPTTGMRWTTSSLRTFGSISCIRLP
jgi:hypothetical protein